MNAGDGDSRRVEIVTLTHQSRRFLVDYIVALAQIDYPRKRLGVNLLDNGSTDGSYGELEDKKGVLAGLGIAVRTERAPANLGFSGGNNRVLKRLLAGEHPPEYVFLLNADTRVEPDCLARLVAVMDSEPDAGMVEARQKPREHPKWYNPETGETGWCSAGGVLIRTAALREVGLFDPWFFLYCEDVDLSWRMWGAGWRCLFCPEAEYWHFTEDTDAQRHRPTQLYYSIRNSIFMRLKYDTAGGVVRHLLDLWQQMKRQPSLNDQRLYRNAVLAALLRVPVMLLGRYCNREARSHPWIHFDGLNYERRRRYVDTADGGRIIFNGR